ncbi:hypothetical protein [Vulcanococcus limneticus]|uniref:hypothetical protein n=1 Tax=Vulcanococcus limneticus TaxID=2170428 RepID=UPI00398C07ED
MTRHPIMNDRIVSKMQLRAIYSILAAIASVAAIKSLIWPRWPEVRPLDQQAITEALNAAGLHATPLKPLAAKRNADLATSAVIGYSLDDGLELRLMRGKARKRFNFQTAFLSTLHPELQLKQRQLTAGPPPAAIGLVANQPALQTCLVHESQASEVFAATREDLSALVDQANQSRWRRLRSIVGLQSNRNYECILIQAKNVKDIPKSIERSTWLRILSLLRPALQSESNRSSL